MKTEDIDKRIGMPDIDAEWAKFEREVMGKKTMPRKLIVWSITSAASIALLAGVLLQGHYIKDAESLQARHGQPVTTEKAEAVKERGAAPASGLTVPAPDLRAELRIRGASGRNDSVLILMDGVPYTGAWLTNPCLAKDLYRQRRCIDSILVYKGEQYEQYVERYGERAKGGVINIKTAPDTLCDAYIREHPEVMKSRRCVEGFVVNENGEPLADAWIYVIRGMAGTVTDSVGHFAFWPPLTEMRLRAECTGYSSSVQAIPSDTILTFRLQKRKVAGDSRLKGVTIR